jgi:hypothetical protein
VVRSVFATALLLHAACPGVPDSVSGEVALTDSPLCDFFVVKTADGFSLLDWRGGISVIAEGDLVSGPLGTMGQNVFYFAGSGEMRAMVELFGADLTRAQNSYYARCHPKQPEPPDVSGAVASR